MMDYRSNQYYLPVDNHSFEEPNTINYSTFSSQMAPKHYNTYGNSFSHSSKTIDNFDGVPISHNYGTFLSQREIIITSQYQDSESSPKSKQYKSQSSFKCSRDKWKRNRRSRSRERKSCSIEIQKENPNYKEDYYSFSNKHQSDSVSAHSKIINKQDGISFNSSSKLSIQSSENQHLDNSSNTNRYLAKSNISISKNLGQCHNSPNSSLESSPLDNEPGYYLNYPSTKKNLVIEDPFSGALYLQKNIQNRDDDNNSSTIAQLNSNTSASIKGVGANYEKDMSMQRSDRNHEEVSQNIHSIPFVQKCPSVILVSSSSEENFDIDFNVYDNPKKRKFSKHNEKNHSGSLMLAGQGNINEHMHSFSSHNKYIPMETVSSKSQSMISVENTLLEKGQVRINFTNENSLGSRENVQTISNDNKDSIIPDFNSDTSKLTPEQWINEIEEMSKTRGWNDDDKRYMMTSRLRGLASKWYLSKGINYKTWDSLKNMFIRAFPTQIEYYTLLKRMMTRKKDEDESISNYFHHKVALLNACEIYGRRAVSCIIFGIPNDKVIHEAKLKNFNNIDSLYSFLSTCHFTSESKYDKKDQNTPSKVEKEVTTELSESKVVKTESSKNRAVKTEVTTTTGVKIKTIKVSKSFNGNRCFRCGSPSHWKSSCKNSPKLCCSRCGQRNVMTKHCHC